MYKKYLIAKDKINKEAISMIKQMAWNTFKNTGSIDSYLELVEVENIEKNIKKDIDTKVNEHEDFQSKGNNYIGK